MYCGWVYRLLGSTQSSFVSLRPSAFADFRASGLDRKFNKAILSTLELVFESTQSPNEEIIYSIVDLHHVPKRQVVDWFAEKRRQTRRAAQGMSR